MNIESRTASASPRELLIAARAIIEYEDSWGKGSRSRRDLDRTCCAAEAIEEALCTSAETRIAAFDALSRAAGIDREFGSLVTWNDAPERTHAEVLAAFDRAIAAAER